MPASGGSEFNEKVGQFYLTINRSLKNLDLYSIDEMELPDVNTSGIKRYGLKCGAGRSHFVVQWDGTMCACTNLSDISADLKKYSFIDAWMNINKKAENILLPEECPECAYHNICMDCLAYHNMAGKPGHCNPKICERTKAFVKAGLERL